MKQYPGYTLVKHEDCPEQHGTLTVLTHDVSGAAVLLVENDDDNKAFGIGFGTFPSDDTGVFHILEHSVLAGSEKYPVKSPFLQLLKSSMASFLNAMTFPDKTVYPFATPNETDFKNLMDVYLNAVFCPLAMVDKGVFEQEGWHRDEDGTVSGVVYNEMQGALATPDAQLQNALSRAMFPDTAYGFVSGGDPASIPALTYEKYVRVYRRHYSADNCCITLYGKMDMAEKLEMLDKQKRQGSKLAFVGDGINDAPVLARADVGIAMGGLGSDAAIEAADVVLMTDEPSKLVEAIDVAKATKRIVMQNIVIALGIKSVFLVLGALGMAGMWEAVFGDVGVTIIAVLNAMRILKK